jgi:peptide/nickel transport system ATP-binding protein
MSDATLEIAGLSVAYTTTGGTVHAVRDASLEVRAGETVALVGESGSGKSSLAFAVMRFLDANGTVTAGRIRFKDQDVLALDAAALRRLRGARISMVFQDPQTSLNPVLRVGEQVAEVVREHLGLGRAAARDRAAELFAQVNLPDPRAMLDRYAHELSGGQQQRVLIAMAFACDPELLIMDEPTTGLDVTTEARILDLIAEMKARHRPAILYITHNLGVVARFCDRVVVMYAGEVVEEGPVARVFTSPLHPYTRGLLTSAPRLDWSKRDGALTAIEGRLPSLLEPPAGCVFESRCGDRIDRCRQVKPLAESVPGGGFSRCLRVAELAGFRFGARRGRGDGDTSGQPGEPLVEARDLQCHYPVARTVADVLRAAPPRAVRAVDGVQLELPRASTLAVVGESGCGKTTLGRAIVGLLEPTAGDIVMDGQFLDGLARDRSRELRRRIQVIFQNPEATLNPQKTVGQTLRRPLEALGIARGREAERRVRELLVAVHLPEGYASRHPHELSGGEKQRVAIARAFAAEPDVIVCDEPLSALDVSVQAAILNLLVNLQMRSSTAYLFISHDLSVVRYLADRVAVMYMGKLCEVGTAADLFAPPYHPYTEALLSAIPLPDPSARQRKVRLEGPVPSPIDPGPGCRFHTRCPRKLGAICERQEPPAQEARAGHVIHCHIPLDDLRMIPPVVEHVEETMR